MNSLTYTSALDVVLDIEKLFISYRNNLNICNDIEKTFSKQIDMLKEFILSHDDKRHIFYKMIVENNAYIDDKYKSKLDSYDIKILDNYDINTKKNLRLKNLLSFYRKLPYNKLFEYCIITNELNIIIWLYFIFDIELKSYHLSLAYQYNNIDIIKWLKRKDCVYSDKEIEKKKLNSKILHIPQQYEDMMYYYDNSNLESNDKKINCFHNDNKNHDWLFNFYNNNIKNINFNSFKTSCNISDLSSFGNNFLNFNEDIVLEIVFNNNLSFEDIKNLKLVCNKIYKIYSYYLNFKLLKFINVFNIYMKNDNIFDIKNMINKMLYEEMKKNNSNKIYFENENIQIILNEENYQNYNLIEYFNNTKFIAFNNKYVIDLLKSPKFKQIIINISKKYLYYSTYSKFSHLIENQEMYIKDNNDCKTLVGQINEFDNDFEDNVNYQVPDDNTTIQCKEIYFVHSFTCKKNFSNNCTCNFKYCDFFKKKINENILRSKGLNSNIILKDNKLIGYNEYDIYKLSRKFNTIIDIHDKLINDNRNHLKRKLCE